jgi:hypothetical protein
MQYYTPLHLESASRKIQLPTPRCPSFQSSAQTYTLLSHCDFSRICPALSIYKNLHNRSPRINASTLLFFLASYSLSSSPLLRLLSLW